MTRVIVTVQQYEILLDITVEPALAGGVRVRLDEGVVPAFHLYREGQLHLDVRFPDDAFEGARPRAGGRLPEADPPSA